MSSAALRRQLRSCELEFRQSQRGMDEGGDAIVLQGDAMGQTLPEHGAALKAHVETKEVRNKGKARKNLPFFSCMEAGETVEREIDPKVFRYIGSVTLAPDMSKQNCVCSEAFEWLMCSGKRMYQHKSGVTGVGGVLKELLDHVCPYYEHVCYPRWSVGTLLTDADYNVDFAFLAGVWRYSHAVGEDYFPCGVRQWPPAL